jgi:hypothetical protein
MMNPRSSPEKIVEIVERRKHWKNGQNRGIECGEPD